jgi:hypothetical protein
MAITTKRAQQIASYYYGGQWTALYQFMGTGYWPKNHNQYIEEIDDSFKFAFRKADKEELRKLKNYFILKKVKG